MDQCPPQGIFVWSHKAQLSPETSKQKRTMFNLKKKQKFNKMKQNENDFGRSLNRNLASRQHDSPKVIRSHF